MPKKHNNLWLPYTQMKNVFSPVKAVKTKGSLIYLDNNKSLIDGISSWWTACHGYNHPHMIKKINYQLKRMPHIMFGGIIHDQAETLAHRISKLLPKGLNKVFFSDSGSVSIEVALKIAIQYWINNKEPQKNKFLFFRNAYHGDTSGAMSICDPEEGMHNLFKNYLSNHIMAELPTDSNKEESFNNLVNKYKNKLAGIIVEPLIQCAGGMIVHKPKVLEKISTLSKKNDIPLIFDEIATGFGRTGSMFAFEQTKTIPDIICLGKALTGGTISLAATISSEKIYKSFLNDDESYALMHGPTYMANPLACSAANASLDLFESQPRLKQVKKIENYLSKNLQECLNFKRVTNVSIKGAMGSIHIKNLTSEEIKWFKQRFINKGIWIRPFGNIIYTTPPFIINKKQLQLIVNSMIDCLKEWSSISKF